jgi:hypothetical protein
LFVVDSGEERRKGVLVLSWLVETGNKDSQLRISHFLPSRKNFIDLGFAASRL